ncbi:hypothetical protein tinsulaeT_12150 [Thalassotalea insulae]|uniref:MSHA biogenesis protein MshI n=1 Tax=Thalassotalea insulae TaxID=2056778 RepID=A0ABQ6GTU6_9GAMM|nr:PilN domain-containing protein [Thalassotalea insulae]GLX77875.1 hypothetical protein tinsulaeT_12150 [Thalassotalea insulae]
MQKLSINLMQDELLAQQPLWTLARVVGLWGIVALAMMSWAMLTELKLAELTQASSLMTEQKQQSANYQADLEKQVSSNQADPLLQEKLATVKLLLSKKKNLHQQLTNVASTYAAGFSQAMTELSELHHKDISLQQVKIHHDQLMFSGLARQPNAVPVWLAKFERATFLSGQSFSHFRLAEADNNMTLFTVSSSAQLVQSGE